MNNNFRHGATSKVGVTWLYKIWDGIKCRTENPNHVAYHNYGGRGIKLSRKWLYDFSAFREYVITLDNCPAYVDEFGIGKQEWSLDRINNDKGYVPGNLRWFTAKEQKRNIRNNRYVTIRGERILLMDAAAAAGLKVNTVRMRLSSGWSVARALSTPVKATAAPTVYVYKGRKRALREIAELTGVKHSTLRGRLQCGYSLNEAIKGVKRQS